ncbi:MAG: hypothetical protein ACE5HS_19315 [bacterium]
MLLAEIIFETDPERAGLLVQNMPKEHPLFKRAEAIQNLTPLLSQPAQIPREAQKEDESKEAWNGYLKGIQALRGYRYEDALSIDKSIAEDGPRKACVALFTFLGSNHKLMKNITALLLRRCFSEERLPFIFQPETPS